MGPAGPTTGSRASAPTQQRPSQGQQQQGRQPLVITRGKQETPIRLFIYGPGGVGKTTLVAESEAPLVVDVNGGSVNIDVPRIESGYVNTWPKLLDVMDQLAADRDYSSFKTIAFDTLDDIEKLCHRFIVYRDRDKLKSSGEQGDTIEAYGYGKGYQIAADEFRKFQQRADKIWQSGRNVIFVGHDRTKKNPNVQGEDYEKIIPAVHEIIAGAIHGQADIVALVGYETVVEKRSKFAKAKVNINASGARVLYTNPHPTYMAKTRYPLPRMMPLDAKEFWAAVKRGQTEDPIRLKQRIEAILVQIRDQDIVAKAREFLALQVHTGPMSRLLERLIIKLSEQQSSDVDQAVAEGRELEEPAAVEHAADPEVTARPVREDDGEPPADVPLVRAGDFTPDPDTDVPQD